MSKITRRCVLKGLAQSAAGVLILNNAASARTYAANEKLNIALIGVGGRGKWYVDVIPKQANVVAFCDVNESKAVAAYREHPEVPKFHDFREMLDKLHKQIDGVDRRHAGPYPRHRRSDGDEGRQTCLRREIAVRMRLRSAHDAPDRRAAESRDADGQPGLVRRAVPPRRGIDRGRRPGRDPGSLHLELRRRPGLRNSRPRASSRSRLT